ncbi:DUF3145 domain-containing protein [Actinopolyspora erythraea]|uniref:DUF3145 domain-containing protein n=1 Tax=Actinopolyspora erythraea TaxID=414996 RepID=A0A099D349_9ACTN|nr:DUF3145 domain-containing protein [Actinopolyspora erythraea]ASU78000.1 DUF3145 domain-containing protein [Actinopolyspora erythraea]KGI79765.1 hypothetical protein IL38_21440 [Actinopolyspora erythraea]
MSTCDSTTGVVYVHSSPGAVCPHVEWAVASVLDTRCEFRWTAQPAAPGQLRAEHVWSGEPGTAARLAGVLRSWPILRFEITEDPGPGADGERFCHVPELGLWRARTGANGDIVVAEDQLRSLMAECQDVESVRHRVAELLGSNWDEALEPFREAGEGPPVEWLHSVG